MYKAAVAPAPYLGCSCPLRPPAADARPPACHPAKPSAAPSTLSARNGTASQHPDARVRPRISIPQRMGALPASRSMHSDASGTTSTLIMRACQTPAVGCGCAQQCHDAAQCRGAHLACRIRVHAVLQQQPNSPQNAIQHSHVQRNPSHLRATAQRASVAPPQHSSALTSSCGGTGSRPKVRGNKWRRSTHARSVAKRKEHSGRSVGATAPCSGAAERGSQRRMGAHVVRSPRIIRLLVRAALQQQTRDVQMAKPNGIVQRREP